MKGSDEMIRCFMDVTIDPESKCTKCCIYCKEKCDYRCELSKECKTEEDVINRHCVDAYEE